MEISNESFVDAEQRLFSELREKADNDSDVYAYFDGDEWFHSEMQAELRKLHKSKKMELIDVFTIGQKLEEKRKTDMMETIERILLWGKTNPENTLFWVKNTSNRYLKVIAINAEAARHFAKYHGHIHEDKNGTVFRCKESYISATKLSGSALGQALRIGKPGVVERRGTSVIVGDMVFLPLK